MVCAIANKCQVNHIHYKSYRAHNPVLGRDRIVVDFDLIYLGDADIQVQADFHMY